METVNIHGILTLYEIPNEWSDEEFKYWWCPVTDNYGQIITPARISDEEKARHIVKRGENLMTNVGITLWLTNASVTTQGAMNPYYQITSVGNGAITGVTRGDTAVAGDAFGTNARKAPASFAITGFTTQVITNYAAGDAVGTWSNVGIYGYSVAGSQNATTTAATGALMTHALYSFVKGSSAYALNYMHVLSN